mgnify:FL=1
MSQAEQMDDTPQWFVMRDLKRSNAKLPAYRMLEEMNIRCFTPMVTRILVRHGKRERRLLPFLPDLLFVFDTRGTLDPIVGSVPTFQYRYQKGRVPMTVRQADMERFIRAVSATEFPRYYRPDEVTPAMRRRPIRIIGGQLDGMEGHLLSVRGSRVRRLLVELPTVLAASVEVEPDFIQLL